MEIFPQFLQKLQGLVLLLVNVLNVVASLHQQEVSNSQIVEQPHIFSLELGKVLQLRGQCVLPSLLEQLGAVWGVSNGAELIDALTNDSQQVEDDGSFLHILTEKLSLVAAFDDIRADSCSFSDFEVPIDEVGQVGEIQMQILLVPAEPLLWRGVLDVLPDCASVGQQQSRHLASASHPPISQSHLAVHLISIYNKIRPQYQPKPSENINGQINSQPSGWNNKGVKDEAGSSIFEGQNRAIFIILQVLK